MQRRGVQAWDKKRSGTELTLGDTVVIDLWSLKELQT